MISYSGIAFFISQPTQRNTLFSHYSLKEG